MCVLIVLTDLFRTVQLKIQSETEYGTRARIQTSTPILSLREIRTKWQDSGLADGHSEFSSNVLTDQLVKGPHSVFLAQNTIVKVIMGNNHQPRILHPDKWSFKSEEIIHNPSLRSLLIVIWREPNPTGSSRNSTVILHWH